MATKFKYITFGTDMLTAAETEAAIAAAAANKQDKLTAGTGITITGTTIKGVVASVDSSLNAGSVNPVTNAAVTAAINGKQSALPAAVKGKYLHANDTTGALEWAEGGGGGGTIDTNMSTTSTNAVQNKVITNYVNGKTDVKQDKLTAGTGISIVGTTISATGLTTIDDVPTAGSSNPVKSSGIYNALQDKEPSLPSHTTTQANKYLKVKANGSLEWADGTGGVTIDTVMDATSTNPVQNKVITGALGGKQDKLTAGDGIAISSENKISATGVTTLQAIEGYYDSTTSKFYSDAAHTTLITPTNGRVYLDLTTGALYQYLTAAYVALKFASTQSVDAAVSTLQADIWGARELALETINYPLPTE